MNKEKDNKEKLQQLVNAFTDFMRVYWTNPDLKAPNIEELMEVNKENGTNEDEDRE